MEIDALRRMCLRYWFAGRPQGASSLPNLSLLHREAASDLEASVYDPVFCLILQGRKETSIGNQTADVGPGDALLVSHHLPVLSRITAASPREPYLAVIVTLDLALIRSLYEQVADVSLNDAGASALAPCQADAALLEPLGRYLDLMDKPLDARVLGPGILRELHYRLLLSPAGGMLRSLLAADSHASRIARAIQVLRQEFRRPLSVPELANLAGMSETSFHQHFKAVTGTTPLQYQKDLRLIAARKSLIEQGRNVSGVAYDVGYESPTHFSRDYRRKFGKAPSKMLEGASPVARRG